MIYNITLFVLAIFPLFTLSQTERMETDRPDQTECPYMTPVKWIQLESGFNYQLNFKRGNVEIKEYVHPTLLSKYGVSKNFELRLITTYLTETIKGTLVPETRTGFEPVEIGGKIRLWEEKKGLPKTSVIFHAAIPKLAGKYFQADKIAPNFRFVMQNTISEKLGLGYNLGAEWDGISTKPTWIYTFSPGFNLGKKGYGYIEAFGFINSDGPPQHSIDGGLAYYVNPDVKLDISAGKGITESAPLFYIAVGASIRFKAVR